MREISMHTENEQKKTKSDLIAQQKMLIEKQSKIDELNLKLENIQKINAKEYGNYSREVGSLIGQLGDVKRIFEEKLIKEKQVI